MNKRKSKRITFPQNIKKLALLEHSKGKRPDEIFLNILNIDTKTISKDKKYASKLLHKWKKEFIKKEDTIDNIIYPNNIIKEIKNIKDDVLSDEIASEMENKYEKNVELMNLKDYCGYYFKELNF